jgi:cytochrome c5
MSVSQRLVVVATVVWTCVFAWAAAPVARAQGGSPRIWQGVYSEAQAARGKDGYTAVCLRCHAPDLAGVTAPALKGDRFMQSFGGEPLDRLFLKVRDTMPPSFGTVIDEQAKLDIVSYILQQNGFPAGPEPLKVASSDLATAQILRQGEQAVVQNFSLVQAVGCLSRGANGAWMLRNAADPVVTKEEVAAAGALSAAGTQRLGGRSYRLLSAQPFNPQQWEGRKVEARGLVYNDPADPRLTLTSLAGVAGACS